MKPHLTAGVALALSLVAGAASEETVLREGITPAVSPDCREVAFVHYENGVMKLGLYDLATQGVRWVENGPGMAAHPTWTPKGDLIYVFGNDTETAYEAFKKNDSSSGYNLRRLTRDGRKVDLTSGRVRDYTPVVSPDGQTVYFASTRWVNIKSHFAIASTSMIGALSLTSGNLEMVVDSPNGQNSGVVNPAVSPNGKVLLWGHLENFFGYWRIYGAKLTDCSPNGCVPFTPEGLIATAPRWHPSGRWFCFQGFVRGDPAWGVWVMEPLTGFVKRICSGENPTFSPDGKRLCFDRNRQLVMRPFDKADEPTETVTVIADEKREPEKVLQQWTGNWTKATELPLDSAKFVFGVERPLFVRAKVKVDGSNRFRMFARAIYGESDLALQLYAGGKNDLWFSTRNWDRNFVGVQRMGNLSRGEHVVTGIRLGHKLYISVDGENPRWAGIASRVALDHPQKLVIGSGLKPGESISSVEIGTGWPNDIKMGLTREEILK